MQLSRLDIKVSHLAGLLHTGTSTHAQYGDKTSVGCPCEIQMVLIGQRVRLQSSRLTGIK